PPLYAFARRRGATPDDAAELIQDFFAALLEGDAFAGFDRGRGRFRSWLLGALRHHDAKRFEAAHAVKRGGRVEIVRLDPAIAERELASIGGDELAPEAAYERAWALGVLRRAEDRLRSEYATRRADAEFAALAPILLHDDDTPYARLGQRLGKSEGAIKVAVHRLRKRFGDLLRREVGETVADPREVDAELRELISAVRRR
ncbi:MAG TPA: sigma factor, partial [Nannocystaceae bacterium]|nr:sigma factor [Nannocystaceae bacterium]